MRPTLFVAFVVACAPVGHRPSASPQGAARAREAAPTAGAVQSSGSVRIEPYAAAPRAVAIVEPREGESVSVDAAGARRVVLDDGGYIDENPGSRVTLVLDGDEFRDVVDVRAPLALGGFGTDGRGIAPGDHTLIAVLAGPRGEAERFGPERRIVTAVRHFSVGAPAAAPLDSRSPRLVLLVPRGTYNGPIHAGSALLDYAVVGTDLRDSDVLARVRIEGPTDVSEATLRGPGPYALRGLGNGDYRVHLELEKHDGSVGSWARTSRTITVNLDAPGR